MTKLCPRCGRYHSGACSIPGNAASGTARTRGANHGCRSFPISSERGAKQKVRLTGRGLEDLLEWGMAQERQMIQTLKTLPSEMPEYQQLLERLDRIDRATNQVRVQVSLQGTRPRFPS